MEIFLLFREFVSDNIFPKDWMVMTMVQNRLDTGLLVYWFIGLFAIKCTKQKKKKLFKLSWRGSPREATGLIRNGLPQLNN